MGMELVVFLLFYCPSHSFAQASIVDFSQIIHGRQQVLLLRTNSSGEQKSAKLINVADKQIDIEKESAIYCSQCEKTNDSRIAVVNRIAPREIASKIAFSSF